MSDTLDTTASALAALGHTARLSVFRLLVQAGHDGLTVGDIAAFVDLPPSTLAHHLRTLVHAGLVIQERRGREILSRPDFAKMDATLAFLTSECCGGLPAAIAKA